MKCSMLILAAIFCLKLSAQSTNYSGSWKLNKENSDFGMLSENSGAISMTVEQEKDSIQIDKRFNKRDGGTFQIVDKLPLNGKSVESFTQEDAKKSVSASKSLDGNFLTIVSTFKGGQDDYTSSQAWSLSVDGKTLIITRADEGTHGTFKLKLVYEKQ